MSAILRTVTDNLLVSGHFPSIRIRIQPQFQYVGGLTFILDDKASVEQHHFVQSSDQQVVQRLLWFQFEGFLDNIQNRYKSDHFSDRLRLQKFEFLHDIAFFNWDAACRERPNSDSAHVVNFLKNNGYRLEGDDVFKRFVWLDQERRNELMIIYSEAIGDTDYRLDDLVEANFAVEKWPALAQALHNRAMASFTFI